MPFVLEATCKTLSSLHKVKPKGGDVVQSPQLNAVPLRSVR